MASLRQPRCNSSSRQCKKSRVGLAGRRELILQISHFAQVTVIHHHFLVLVEEPDQRGHVLCSLGESDCNFQFLMENEFKDSTPQEKNTPFESGVSSDVAGAT